MNGYRVANYPRSETKTAKKWDYETAEMSIPSSSHSYSYKHITFTTHPPPQVYQLFGTPLPPKKPTSSQFLAYKPKRPRKLYYPSVLVDPDGIQSWLQVSRCTGPGMRWDFFFIIFWGWHVGKSGVWAHLSGQIMICHQPRFPWNKGISLPKSYLLGAQVVSGRYNLIRLI